MQEIRNVEEIRWFREFGGTICGRIVRLDAKRRPYVEFATGAGIVMARTLRSAGLTPGSLREDVPVLLVFEDGDPTQPIIVGLIDSSIPEEETKAFSTPEPACPHAVIDRKHVILRGQEEVTLICGNASITLRKNGRIVLRGVDVISRASSSNKIRGASVSIN
jgi:hypothetical protein